MTMNAVCTTLWLPPPRCVSQLRPAALGLHLLAELLHVALVKHLEPLPVRDAGGVRRTGRYRQLLTVPATQSLTRWRP